MNIANNFMNIIQEKNLSISELSSLTEMVTQDLDEILNGHYFPTRIELRKVIDVLDVQVKDLLPFQERLAEIDEQKTEWLPCMSFNNKDIIHCYYLDVDCIPLAKYDEPSFILYGVDTHLNERYILGYYDSKENINREITAFMHMLIDTDDSFYHLQFQSKVKKRFLKVKLIK